MFKTFKLDKVEEEVCSATEGKMTFHLIDENGDSRTVWGTTKLDENQKALSITTQKKREHPLIQCLFNTELNEVINIEFEQYNAVIERNDNEVNAQTIEEIAKEMQSKSFRLGPMLKSTIVKSTESIH